MSVSGLGARGTTLILLLTPASLLGADHGAVRSTHAPLPALGEAPADARLVWIDAADSAATLFSGASRETAAVLRSAGVEVSWRRAVPYDPVEDGEIRVILVASSARSADGEAVLGATPQGQRSVGSVMWIHVPAVVATLSLPADRMPPDPHGRHALGVALGRVIAHEAVHCLAPELEHGKGLMSHRLGRRQLMGAHAVFEPSVAVAVREAVARRAVRVAPDSVLTAIIAEGRQ
jgi:hypothetical protein